MEMTPKQVESAVKHYESMRRAQKKYYEKKAGPVEMRRPRGRPPKTPVAEGGQENVAEKEA